jgi:hypothetical protein
MPKPTQKTTAPDGVVAENASAAAGAAETTNNPQTITTENVDDHNRNEPMEFAMTLKQFKAILHAISESDTSREEQRELVKALIVLTTEAAIRGIPVEFAHVLYF